MRSEKPGRKEIHVYVTVDLYRRLKKKAKDDHRSMSSLVVKTLADLLNEQQNDLLRKG